MIDINTMKSYNISLIWEKNEVSNHVSIQENHLMKIRALIKDFLRARKVKKYYSTSILAAKIIQSLKRRLINVYATNVKILKIRFNRNVFTQHKLITKDNYVFEFITQKNLKLNLYATTIHALITNKLNSILLMNFEIISTKIRQNQLFNKLRKSSDVNTTSHDLNFNYANVFLEKYSIEDSRC